MAKDLTPKYPIVSAREKIVVPENFEQMADIVGGFQSSPQGLDFGKLKLQATEQRILFGDATAPLTGIGIFQGLDNTDYEFRVGDPDNDYLHWDGSALTIVGDITATTGTIGGWTISSNALYIDTGTDATSSGMASGDYPFYAGKEYASRATAPFRVTPAGALTASDATITGALTAGAGSSINGTYLTDGTVVSSKTSIAISGWTHDLVFSASSNVQVAWDSGTIALSDGSTTYAIDAGNTGTMSAINYIYLDVDTSTTVLQTTTTYSTAIGDNKILIAVAENVAADKKATFQVYGGRGGVGTLLTTDNLAANCVTANLVGTNEIIANTANIANAVITNAKISDLAVSKLTAGTIDSKSIVLASATGDVEMRSGIATGDFANAGENNGFIFGLDYSDSAKVKFYWGRPGHSFSYDNEDIELVGGDFSQAKLSEEFTAGEDIKLGNAVVVGDGNDIVLTGQGTTDDSYIECGEDGNTTYFAQPFKFNKDFVENDTFEIELYVKGTTSLFTNDLNIYICDDNSGEPLSIAGSTMKENINKALVISAWTKQNASFTVPAGGLDKDTVYWLVIWSDEAYQFKTNRNLYYQFYTKREFPDEDYELKKNTSLGGWHSYGFDAEFYFKILVPTENGKIYLASCWGVENNFPKIAIGLANDNYSKDDTISIATFGTLSNVSIDNVDNLGDNVYLNYGGGKLIANPPDISRTYAIGQVVSGVEDNYKIKLNLESNLLQ